MAPHSSQSNRNRWPPLLLLVLAMMALAACREAPQMTTILVTQVVTVEDAGVVATRVVRRTIEVTATPPPPGQPIPQPVVLDIGLTGRTPTLDPQLASRQEALDLVENLYVGLTRHDPQSNQIVPELAESWTVSDDSRVWTFRLRDDFFWLRPGSGNPQIVRQVVAGDVVNAIRRGCDPQRPVRDTFLLFVIAGCEAVGRMPAATEADLNVIGAVALDDTTLQVTLVKPANHFLALTSLPLLRPVAPELEPIFADEAAMAAALIDRDSRVQRVLPEGLITSGPFYIGPESVRDRRLTLHRNPLWPVPFSGNVDIVNLIYFDDAEAAHEVWQGNQLDLSPPLTAVVEQLQIRNPQKLILKPSQAVFYLGFNFDSGVLRVPEVRRALSAAVDRERLVQELYGGAAVPLRHFSPPGVVDAPPYDVVGTGFSPSYAKQQMAASGFRDCRLMPPITYMVSSSDLALRQAELIRDMWMDNLNCTKDQFLIEQAQFGTLLANTRREAGGNRPDMWDLGWESQYPDANNWLGDVLHCIDSENRQNRPCGPVDDLIRRADVTPDLAERPSLYRQAETMFFAEDGIHPLVPLYARGAYLLRQVWVSFTPASFGGEQYDTYRIDVEVKRFERER